ncbi:DnaB-like helicase C-terminal domain-containing protein [Streptomyces sp. NPDC050788]|uniref:DnaB-like helicase C-terminal domain-containing protein n=1 Tax=Streptomyces sp. NPDC050788 TaxID=3155041 RepID=UPI003432F7A6
MSADLFDALLLAVLRFGESPMSARSAVPVPSASGLPTQGVPAAEPETLGVSDARNRLYELVDAAEGEGRVTVIVKRDAKAGVSYRAALIPVGRLDAAARARLEKWPSWARTAARPKLGDRVVDAAGRPGETGVPQVLLDRTTPLALLVDASLVPSGDGLVAVPDTDVYSADAERQLSSASPVPEMPAEPVEGPAPEPLNNDPSAPAAAGIPATEAVSSIATATSGLLASATAVPALPVDGAPGAVRDTGTEMRPEAAHQDTGRDSSGTTNAARTTPAGKSGGPRILHDLGDVVGQALTRASESSAASGFGFGLRVLDAALGDLPAGVLTVVAAAPHAGGSLLAVHAARHAALSRQLPVLYAASGLTRTDVAMRVIAAEAGLDYRRLRTGDLTEDEQHAAAAVQARLTGAALHIDDGTGLSAEAIAETAPYVEGLALVVVDRLQHRGDPLVPLSGPALTDAARILAHLARRLDLPVVAALDTDDPAAVAALDAAHLTLTLTRTDTRAEVVIAERDFGELTTVTLHADLRCARFTDPPETKPMRQPDTASAALDVMEATATAGPAGAGVPAGEGTAALETELLDAALPFTSGAQQGLPARLTGTLAALREAATTPGRAGELPGLHQMLADLAARRPTMPPTPAGERLGVALTAFAAHRPTPAPLGSGLPQPATGTPGTGPNLDGTADLAAAEAELLTAAEPYLTGTDDRSTLSTHAQHVLATLRDALLPGHDHLLPAARARATELGARRLRLPPEPAADRLRAALTTYHATATAAGTTPAALPTPAATPPTASMTVTEPAPVAEDFTTVPGTTYGTQQAEEPDAAASASFRDDTPPPEGTPGTGTGSGGRNYTFFLNKITDAVEQALDETDGDIEAAVKALKKKAVPDSMALFKLTRVGGNYVHTVYPPALDFLSKPAQGAADQIWEGRHKWRNAPLYAALKAGTQTPLDVYGLDTNAAYLSAFKTHLPIGALVHHPTGGFDRKRAGIHRVDHFEWPHEHLPSPLGNRIEPGPYLLDEATVRLLIRCSELGLCEAPRILESWTSGASEGLLEKFRRVLHQARTTAIETADTVTEEYVKAMYSRFTSTIGESAKNRELRRPEWVHIIRSQAFANLWLKAWKAHQASLILVQVSGVDELHIAGGDWKNVWEEGRKPTQMKEKRFYTLGETK